MPCSLNYFEKCGSAGIKMCLPQNIKHFFMALFPMGPPDWSWQAPAPAPFTGLSRETLSARSSTNTKYWCLRNQKMGESASVLYVKGATALSSYHRILFELCFCFRDYVLTTWFSLLPNIILAIPLSSCQLLKTLFCPSLKEWAAVFCEK